MISVESNPLATLLNLSIKTSSTTMADPTPSVFIAAATKILRRKVTSWSTSWHGRWMSLFGANPSVCCSIWIKINPQKTMAEIGTPEYAHLLWGLY